MISTPPPNDNAPAALLRRNGPGLRQGSAGVLVDLLAEGDVSAILRRVYARLFGRPLPLPRGLAPLVSPPNTPRAASATRTQRAIMISPSLNLTGAPISQAELAAGLAARGWSLAIWTASDGPVRQVYDDVGLSAHIEPRLIVRQSSQAAYERDVEILSAAIAEAGAPLIYVNTIDMFPAIDAARRANAPSIWNIRESEPWRLRLADRHPLVAARALGAFSYPQSVVFVAQAAARAWQDFAPSDSPVIYNAPHARSLRVGDRVASRKRLGARENSFVFASVGTLCARKGQMDIAHALARLDPAVLERVEIVLIGDAEARYEQAFNQSLTDKTRLHVRRLGVVEDAPSLLAGADALINTSRSEAFPRTFIEAAAAGLPILAAEVDGASERLTHGESALFYAPEDVKTLAAHMTALATDAGLGHRLAAGARRALVTSWTFDDMIEAYESLFAQAAATP